MHRVQELTAMEMKLQIIMAILCLALLMWVDAASAQSTYSLSVSRHDDTPELSAADVRVILEDASKMLQKNAGHVDTDNDHACNVTFTLKGPIGNFASTKGPAVIETEHDRDAVHKVVSNVGGVNVHVKVVNEIKFCRPGAGHFAGCSFPIEFHSIIVVHPKKHRNPDNFSGPPLDKYPDHLLWVHEFGHLTGLGHRLGHQNPEDRRALMTGCPLNKVFSDVPDARVQVNRRECGCLRSGLGSCELPPPHGC
jgi:hypothetical protein